MKLRLFLLLLVFPLSAFATCASPANAIEQENCLTGSPKTAWDIQASNDAGDPTIQGFATDISFNVGQTVSFKIKTPASAYMIDIYRMGYYGGMGARLITSVTPSAKLPQSQPACFTDSSTGLVDCGNWAVSASWQIPATAVSGIYFAHLIRKDTGGDSHIVFIVRNDSSHSSILFQTSDETWQAYNGWGGSSLYGPDSQFNINARALKVSYNRPFDTRGFGAEAATWVFGAEYPMVRFLEANGYDVTYFTGIDAARNGNLITNHKIYMTTGHDEYWSGPHRVNVEAARDAGVNMAFFSGNEVFWKTRLEPSMDGSNTQNRTLACYKETLAGTPIDPLDPPTWTGTWRDNRFSPPADGGRPENSLTGTIFMVNGPGVDNDGTLAIKVPAADGKMRFWRKTTIANLAAGATATLPSQTLGYEWDEDLDNGSRPAGLIHLSTATYSLTSDLLLDQGAVYGAGSATHHLTLYRAPSGALVFGAGTVQWSWGLDSNHDDPFAAAQPSSSDMQQATVNLFADMGVQPATLIAGLQSVSQSADTTPPSSTITSPANGSSISSGSSVSITGTATDSGGGAVGGVEVSVDGGSSWHPASGRESWSYTWKPIALGSFHLISRASDDSANLESTSSSGSVITVTPPDCPCSSWPTTAAPAQVDSGDTKAIELGVRFHTDFDGYITGVRFYKASTNTGTHVGNLWSKTGTLLASATFTNETASGWQQVNFSAPVAVTANTTYVASYFAPAGHYSYTTAGFASSGVDLPPVHLLRDGLDGSDGVYAYNPVSAFPSSTFESTNYWVDVVFIPSGSMPGAPPGLLVNPSALNFAAFSGQANPVPQTVNVYNEGGGVLNWSASSNAGWLTVTPSGTTPGTLSVSVNASGLAIGTYTGTITVSSPQATNGPQTISVSLVVTNLYLFSNFADGTMNGWAFSPLGFASNWSVANSALQYNGGGHTQVYAGNSGWTDYTLNVAVKLASLSDYPGGIRGRLNPSTGSSYAAWLYPAEGVIRLFRNSAWNIDTGLVELSEGPVKFDTTKFHNIQLSFQGSQITVSYDGQKVVTATDATYTSGAIALDVATQAVSFTNVLVTSNLANGGSLSPATNSMSFSSVFGANPAPQNEQLNTTGGSVVWSAASNAAWLSVSPAYGVAPNTPKVVVTSSSLSPGTYNGTITFYALGTPQVTKTVVVSLSIPVPPPSLALTPQSFTFVSIDNQPVSNQILAVTNGAVFGTFSWTASSDSPSWLSLSSTSGSTPQNVTVAANPAGLSVGTYTGNITVSAAGISNSPVKVPVTLQVLTSDMSETFSDMASGWIISPMGMGNGWSVANGTYSYSGLGFSQSCAGNSNWTDYTFDTNVRLATLSNWPGGVRGRVNPLTGAGYAVWLYPGSSSLILYSVPQWNINGAGVTQLAVSPLSFDTNAHDLKMDFHSNLISVYWDGALLMSATDNSFSSGFVCLDADTQPISYSNVRVAAVQNHVTLDSVTPSSLTFSSVGSTAPAAQSLNVTAGGAQTTWAATSNVSWLTVSTSTTMTPGQLTVAANPAGLSSGSYSGTVTISAPGASNSPLTIPVTLSVETAALSTTPSSLAFFAASGTNPAAQTLQIRNLGIGTMNWTASKTSGWLSLSTTSGTAPSTITVSADSGASGNGSFTDTITVTAAGAANSPANIPVSFQVGPLLFSDDFSAGAGQWSISPLGNAAGWSVTNGAYAYNGGGHTQSYAGNPTWTDYSVVTDFQLSSVSDYPGGLRGRVNTSTGASYAAWIYPTEGIVKLYRISQWNIDAGFALLATSGPLSMDTNRHNLRLSFQGSSISVYYDNALVITTSDATYTQGAIALDVSNQPISFDNVSVISLP